MVNVELHLKAYLNPKTNELQLYRYIIQDKSSGHVLYDEKEEELLKFYSKEDAMQYIYEQSCSPSDFKIRKVGANTIADLTLQEKWRRIKNPCK